MITRATIERIYGHLREIEAGNQLLADMERAAEEGSDEGHSCAPLTDVFGWKRQLELGIPCGKNCHRLLQVAPELAVCVIRAHIAKQEAELVEANEQARIELGMSTRSPS
ncbi:hypothetical protein M0R72_14575 [Candidatus Pacearchaeota archaeon]|jgi:hypothetical protein|nr:hypothetical protein [Candidatus Pacearchaeota archaeon]